ncbi:MAG: M3 family metallopeptidase [Rikenellaceae bacterium]
MITTSSCGSGSSTRNNPLLAENWETPYNMPPLDKIEARDYLPALDLAIEEQERIIEGIVADTTSLTFEGVILALDNSDIRITEIFNIFTMVEASNSTPQLAEVNSVMMPRLSVQSDKVLLNQQLFAKVKGVYDIRHELKLVGDELRLTEKIYDKFVRNGANLNELSRTRLAIINEEIAALRVKFSQNLMAENSGFYLTLDRTMLDGLPSSVRETAASLAQQKGLEGKWVITLQTSSMIPFLTFSQKRELREEIFKAYISRGQNGNENDNREIVAKITKLRIEKAKILGFNNYAELVISDQMAQSPEAAYELMNDIWGPALELAGKELQKMKRLLRADDEKATFGAWDWWYYAEKIRSQEYALAEDDLKVYFSVEGVRNGAFMLANRLYGITFRPIITPQYENNCVSYEAIDEDGTPLGVLHFDLYTRPTKGQGAWCGFIREQRYEDGERVAPIVSISCNFALPTPNNRTLLTMDEVETLFHEFGHALHFLFQDVKYRGLSEVEGDFVELPSQIMENWAFEPQLLKNYAISHQSGVVIPDKMVENITRSRLFNQGFMTTEIAAASLLDLDLHMLTSMDGFDVESFESESLTKKRGLIPQIEPRYHLTYFSHLFTFEYASGYYFYLWAEVLDKDAFDAFKKSGDIFNKQLANKFRHEILERGGSEDGGVMYRNFRGSDPTRDALLIARGVMEPPKPQEIEIDSVGVVSPRGLATKGNMDELIDIDNNEDKTK